MLLSCSYTRFLGYGLPGPKVGKLRCHREVAPFRLAEKFGYDETLQRNKYNPKFVVTFS